MSALLSDIRYGLRMLFKNPGLTAAALGAGSGDSVRLVLRQGIVLTLIGAAMGLVVAWGVTRHLSGLLLGVSATDPVVFSLVLLFLVSSAGLANYVPAGRASRVDPVMALKYE